jgi:hypothetical protein
MAWHVRRIFKISSKGIIWWSSLHSAIGQNLLGPRGQSIVHVYQKLDSLTLGWNRKFVKLKSWILEVEFVKLKSLKSWILEVEFVKLKSWIREVEIVKSWSWNREFMKLNRELVNSVFWKWKCTKFKLWIHEDESGNSWSWNGPTGLSYYIY